MAAGGLSRAVKRSENPKISAHLCRLHASRVSSPTPRLIPAALHSARFCRKTAHPEHFTKNHNAFTLNPSKLTKTR